MLFLQLVLLNSHEYVPFDTQMNNTLRLIGGGCLLYIYIIQVQGVRRPKKFAFL